MTDYDALRAKIKPFVYDPEKSLPVIMGAIKVFVDEQTDAAIDHSAPRMIRVNLQEIGGYGSYNEIREMPAVPRVGDTVHMDTGDGGCEVRSVMWVLSGADFDVQVRFR